MERLRRREKARLHDGHRVFAVKWRLLCDGVVERSAEAIHVAAEVDLLALHLFWRYVERRSPNLGLLGVRRRGDAEIDELRRVAVVHQDVAGLDVAVNEV